MDFYHISSIWPGKKNRAQKTPGEVQRGGAAPRRFNIQKSVGNPNPRYRGNEFSNAKSHVESIFLWKTWVVTRGPYAKECKLDVRSNRL